MIYNSKYVLLIHLRSGHGWLGNLLVLSGVIYRFEVDWMLIDNRVTAGATGMTSTSHLPRNSRLIWTYLLLMIEA